jgi:hypothetical protein
LSPDLLRQISARRDEFERAWIAGRSPSMEDGLADIPLVARPYLLRALLAVEIEHRKDGEGVPITEQQLIAAYPRLAPDLQVALEENRQQATRRLDDDQLDETAAHVLPDQAQATNDQRYMTRDQGFHIRCPHCSNPVELLDDSSYESINCASCGSVFSLVDRQEQPRAAQVLKSIGRFELAECLGSGGFGTVWKARDPELDRIVALKVPRAGRLTAQQSDFFFREARAAAQLRHPNIVPVHEVGRDGDTLFIVSDFVKGITLTDWLKGRRATPLAIAEMCSVISEGLHHAHQKGVVHRDLKPQNILIDDSDQPHIMDFGLAKREVGEVTMTMDGQILGTPAYMSPEQAGGEGHWTDRRTDIYSLGVMTFEMLTGELPFRGNYQMQIRQRLTEDAPDPRKLNRNISGDLATICTKCMDRNPNRRYATATDVAAEFRRFMNGEPIVARPLSAPARLGRWAKRKPLVATVAALTVFLAIAGPTAAFFFDRQRSRLAELVGEKNNLIDQGGVEKRRDAAKITKLNRQLDLWEGRANPWEIWPPKRDQTPRQRLVGDFAAHSSAPLLSQLRDGKFDDEGQARGYLGLAMLAAGLGHTEDSLDYYRQAREQLVTLQDKNPHQPQYSLALAECDADVAELTANSNREEAAKKLEDATAIRRRLAGEHKNDLAYQIVLLDSESRSAVLAGFESAAEHLMRASSISQSLATQWPSDPVAFYRLACFLTLREPLLTTVGTDTTAKSFTRPRD